jgi:hypothetical protein
MVRGTVVDEKGAPMPNAFVAIMRSPTSAGPNTYSDANGAYAIGGVDPGLKVVEARQWRYQTVDREVDVDGVTPVNFAMQLLPQVTFSGIVSDADSGAPIPGATVTFLDTAGARDNAGLSTVSDSGGRYRFEKVYTANSNLSATARGFQEWRTGLHVYGDTVLNFQLRALGQPQTFTGTVGGPPASWTCVTKVPASVGRGAPPVDAPCADFPFTMRRTGDATASLTVDHVSGEVWLQLLAANGQPIQTASTYNNPNDRADLKMSYLGAGSYILRVVRPWSIFAEPPVKFTVSLTKHD